MVRKLASVQKIISLSPIENADKIEKATVLGWELVVKKGEFKVDDFVVYIEIDSIMPEKPEFEFLRVRKFKVKTIKLRGQVSQGICFPLSILSKKKYIEGQDVTELIGVTKYESGAERQERIQNEIKSNRVKKFFMKYSWFRRLFTPDRMHWPDFIKKTDEDRIQVMPQVLQQYKDEYFEITEKLDGQSGTYFLIRNPKKWQFWKPFIFGVCSRNFLKGKKENNTWWRIAEQYDIENKLKQVIDDNEYIVIQGELIGESIQKNKYDIKGLDFYVFNVFTDKQNNSGKFKYEICKQLNLKEVPFITNDFQLKDTINEMVEYAKGKSVLKDIHREGIVVRNYSKNISFKVVNPDFLLKYEE